MLPTRPAQPFAPVGVFTCADVAYSLPHLINRQAIVAALRQEGVTKVVGFGSVGGLKAEFGPGTVSVCDDFFNLWTATCLNNDASAHIGTASERTPRGVKRR